MDTNLGDKTDAGNHAAIPGPSISDLTDVALLDNADFGLVLDHNTLDPNGFDMNFDELWSNDFNQSPGDANITQNHLQQLNTFDSSSNQSPIPTPSTLPPKVGHRFTLEALRSLKEWLSAHTDNPYPTEEEKTILEHQTGLSRTQITNWLANARRRRTITDGRASGNTQVPEGYTPTRSGTPIPRRGQPLRDLNPLQRWENSPPENEPATASDIARAMESGELIRSRSRRGTFASDEKTRRRRRHRRLSALRIKGRNALFEECPLESRLQAFVRTQRAKGIHAVSDEELQREAGRIMLQMESELQAKPEYVANWLIGFLNHSTGWIGVFRQRAELVLVSDSQNAVELNNISQWQDGAQWQVGGSAWLTGNDWLLVGHGDAAGDNTPWGTGIENSTDHTSTDASLRDFTWLWSDDQSPPAIPQSNPSPEAESQSTLRPTWLGPGIYVLNDPNHIPWFAREMKRWVKAAMSPNNPISHVPSDEELRHQARCLLYNDDDPWNQTAADNAQWLEMFKKDVGIL
ncbi:hypothetical protein FPSE5266_04442 [Fusarium pseudograminearum]|nr:hypothetical protein FPSE5266_04442 [Fusarium pseudograminearum]